MLECFYSNFKLIRDTSLETMGPGSFIVLFQFIWTEHGLWWGDLDWGLENIFSVMEFFNNADMGVGNLTQSTSACPLSISNKILGPIFAFLRPFSHITQCIYLAAVMLGHQLIQHMHNQDFFSPRFFVEKIQVWEISHTWILTSIHSVKNQN